MAVYNTRADYLALAIRSILNQTLTNFEFIIVDDGSEAATQRQLAEFAASDARIRLLRLNQNVGLTRALNVGLKHVSGKYVARQDADDVSNSERLAITVAFLDKNSSLDAAGTYVELIGHSGQHLGMSRIEPDIRQLKSRNVLVHGSMVFRKSSIDRIGGYNESMRLAQDYEMYLRMIRHYGMSIGVVNESLYIMRQHSASLSSRYVFRQLYFSVLAKTLTASSRNIAWPKMVFIKTIIIDLIFTHRLLLGPASRAIYNWGFNNLKESVGSVAKNRFTAITACRICANEKLFPVLSLGEQYLTGIFPRNGQQHHLTKGPLDLVKCQGDQNSVCGLLQLRHSYNSDEMYGDNYGYRSGLNASMVAHLRHKVDAITSLVSLSPNDLVIDIGSNDGTTLAAYPPIPTLVGIDPTGKKFVDFYPPHVNLIPQLFSAALIEDRYPGRKAKVVTSFSMLYDLENPIDFVSQIARLLDPVDGIWVFEQSYMPLMLERMAFDTICHEHIEYYGLKQIQWVLERTGLEILRIDFNEVNGGSFSVVASHKGSRHIADTEAVRDALAREDALRLDDLDAYTDFVAGIELVCEDLKQFMNVAKLNGKRVCGIGASTKGNVLLQRCGATKQLIEVIGEVNPDKFGCMTPGTWIPIANEIDVLASKPDYLLVLPWHFRENFLSNPLYIGHTLVFPLPKLEIVQL
jgi:NDP-4-keto-2,6-dideoxyhexose 3-C-methyltransferase